MSLEEAQAERARREKQRAETAGGEKDKRKSDKPRKGGVSDESDVSKSGVSDESDARLEKTCFQFQANGSCNYGESYRFEHVPGDGKRWDVLLVSSPVNNKLGTSSYPVGWATATRVRTS